MTAKVYTVKAPGLAMTAPSLVEAASLARDLSRDGSVVEVRTNKVMWAVQVFVSGCEMFPAGTGGQGKAPRWGHGAWTA